MLSTPLNHHRLVVFVLLLSSLVVINFYSDRLTSYIKNNTFLRGNVVSICFKWQSIDYQESRTHRCEQNKHIISLVWTHNGTGLMKYIQWIVTRKLGNMKVTQLNDDCEIIREHEFFSISYTTNYIQIYLVSLTANIDHKSECSMELFRVITSVTGMINQIYFKRRSTRAFIFYQHLDAIRHNHSFIIGWNDSYEKVMNEKVHFITEHFLNYFATSTNINCTIIDSEDMIHSNLIDTETTLTNFLLLLGLNTSMQVVKDIIHYDSYQFTKDATWWDQSDTAEQILAISRQSYPSNLIYSNDFYHLHGHLSFEQCVSDNRQCFNDGIFPQLPFETSTNHLSTDKPERCSSKRFDCAFSDLYSFADRERIYHSYNADNYFYEKPVKCAFAIHSILDKVRNRYVHNHTCQTIVFTSVINCYDPLPVIQGTIPSGSCFVALLDTKTINGFQKFYSTRIKSNNKKIQWDFINLELNGSLFRVTAKLPETLKVVGHRMFPMAKWIIWLDGKAHITNISNLLAQARTPIIGPRHPSRDRTSESEVKPTISRVRSRKTENFAQLSNTLQEIELQQAEYKQDGFYSRSATLELKMFDIAAFIYRNNHPCVFRYLCAWHNEINYYSFRGQLSVYYPAVRLNLTDYLSFVPEKFFFTVSHQSVC